MSGVHVVSLISNSHQVIMPGRWQLLRFPFGRYESFDEFKMHQIAQPDGEVSKHPDERSGLIWPSRSGWGMVEANIHWEDAPAGTYDQLRGRTHRYSVLKDRFVRDPLDLLQGERGDEGPGGNATGRDQRAPAPGAQAFTKHHGMFVFKNLPIGIEVAHDADESVKVVHAQFKLTIWDVEPR